MENETNSSPSGLLMGNHSGYNPNQDGISTKKDITGHLRQNFRQMQMNKMMGINPLDIMSQSNEE